MNVNILWDRAIGLKNSQPAYSILPGFLNDYLGRILRSLGRSLGSLNVLGHAAKAFASWSEISLSLWRYRSWLLFYHCFHDPAFPVDRIKCKPINPQNANLFDVQSRYFLYVRLISSLS